MKVKFQSISDQVAAALRAEINDETWRQSLPGERQLAERLRVSRKTIRKALAQLRREGALDTQRGRPSVIVPSRASRTTQIDRVALLLPQSPEHARPFTLLWINRLMALLQDGGYYLEIFHGSKYYSASSGRSLARLTATYPSRCWILARSNSAMQRWFVESGLPALVCGSTHHGISLPSVDIDHRSLCRHAATMLLRLGHRRLGMFLDGAGHAGDTESEEGFREGLITGGRDVHAPVICRGERKPGAIVRELKRILSLPAPPTGLLLFNSEIYLTVSSYLGTLGLRVPEDVSLVSRDEEPFLQFIHPLPTRYSAHPAKFANKLSQAFKRINEGERGAFSIRIMPTYVPSASVGKPKSAS